MVENHDHNGINSPKVKTQNLEGYYDPFSTLSNHYPVPLNGGNSGTGGTIDASSGALLVSSGTTVGQFAAYYSGESLKYSNVKLFKFRAYVRFDTINNGSTGYIYVYSLFGNTPTKYHRLRIAGNGSGTGNVFFEASNGTTSQSINVSSAFNALSSMSVYKDLLFEIVPGLSANVYADRKLLATIKGFLPSYTSSDSVNTMTLRADVTGGGLSTALKVNSPHALIAF
jgi:hypothetical protein